MFKKASKRLFAVFLVMVLMEMLPGVHLSIKANADSAPSGNWSSYYSAPTLSGTAYTIESAENLAWVAYKVNSGTTFSGYTFNVTADIDLSAHYWTPIGSSSTLYFNGTFNGNSKVISNFTIGSSSSPDSSLKYLGLFGYATSATINNVWLEDISIYSSYGVNSSYYARIGGIAGYLNGASTTSSCHVTGYITNTGKYHRIGGIIGHSYNNTGVLTVKNCYSQCIVYVTNSYSYYPAMLHPSFLRSNRRRLRLSGRRLRREQQ